MAEEMAQKLPTMTVKPLTDDFEFKDWELVEDVGPASSEFELELAEFLRGDETYVSGETMLERAKEMEDLAGQRHAEKVLRRPENIPVEWRTYVLVFAGTVRSGPGGGRRVLCFGWHGGRWCSYWGWFGDGFRSRCRVARLGK